ncbi:MAG: cytochrome c3 family protein [Rhodothermales bacterium]|nr:cytochrome c3 family protein [Rhodothermales bacterium]
MAQIFPRKANILPHLSLAGAAFGGVLTILIVWYYFSPEFTDVGYAPEQPVPYSHELHAGQLGMDCRYCHNWVEVSAHANVPPTQTCMNCHGQIRTQSLALLPVRESWATGLPIPWVKVHHLPDYAHFSHAVHVDGGVGCETCHGRIDQMEVVYQVEPLSMGWCLECHREPELYLRPTDEVTTMGYVQPADFVERNLERIRREGIQPPTNCSACHY